MADPIATMATEAALAATRGRVPALGPETDPARMRQAAEEFEAVFLATALEPMFANTDASSPFGGGHAEGIWRSLEVRELGKALSRSGGIGIADAVMRDMIRMQAEKEDTP